MSREAPDEPSREELNALIAALMADNEALKARIAELERQLGLNARGPSTTVCRPGGSRPQRLRAGAWDPCPSAVRHEPSPLLQNP
jgi:hypothetical protein